MIVAMYLRKSRQEEESDSVEETLARHKLMLTEFAAQNGYDVREVYEEVVSGGYLYARPQMLRLLADVEKGLYDAILCMDIDRLCRGGLSDQGYILETLKASHTLIVTPRKVYDLNNDLDETYSEFETFLARQELKTISRRLQRGLHKTIEEGGYVANAPYGYHKTTIDRRPTLEIFEPEARYVRMMFDWYANERVGCQTIAHRLNQLGSTPHRAAEWGRTSVMRILRNPTYDGKVVWDRVTHIRKGRRGNQKHIAIYNPQEKWTITEGLHPALVPHELFERVQEIFAGRYHSPSFNGTIENPLAGIVLCANCGAPMQRLMAKGHVYLNCVRRGCMVSSKLEEVENAVLSALRMQLAELETKANQAPAADEARTSAYDALQSERKTVAAQLSKLHDLLEQGVYDTETFFARRARLTDRLQALDVAMESSRPAPAVDYRAMAQLLSEVLRLYDGAAPQMKNSLLKSCLEKAVYNREKGSKTGDFSIVVTVRPMYF